MVDRENTIEELRVKLEILIKKYNDLDKYKEKANLLKEENILLKKQYDELKIASTLKTGSTDIKQTKLYISQLIREIDKCIALLNVSN